MKILNFKKINYSSLNQFLNSYNSNFMYNYSFKKTRGMVNYSNIKLYKQKGTGKARIGNRKSPILVGGGICFFRNSLKRKRKINKKFYRICIKKLICHFIIKNKFFIVNFDFIKFIKSKYYYKKIFSILENKKILFLSNNNIYFLKSIKNIKKIYFSYYQNINPNIFLKIEFIFISVDIFRNIILKYEN
ncbi:50S ribosomal protein L4 [Candidatus Vidania fulgoroideorum]